MLLANPVNPGGKKATSHSLFQLYNETSKGISLDKCFDLELFEGRAS